MMPFVARSDWLRNDSPFNFALCTQNSKCEDWIFPRFPWIVGEKHFSDSLFMLAETNGPEC